MNLAVETMIRVSKRSWWQARYFGGRVISEWDTGAGSVLLPVYRAGKTSRWEEVSKNNMVALRLLCPNGMCGDLEAEDLIDRKWATEGHKFFQLKSGHFGLGEGHTCDAHIIGLVLDKDGDCLCFAWQMNRKTGQDGKLIKWGELVKFQDNVFKMKYQNIGALSLDVQGLKL